MHDDKIKVICLDLNDTLVKEKTWPNLNFAMGMTPEENTMFYNLHRNSEITYTMWVEIALGIYRNRKNLTQPEIEKITSNYTYFLSAEDLVKYLKQKYTVVIVSCAMDMLVEKVAKNLGVKHFKSLTKFFFNKFGHISQIKVDDRTGDEAKNKVHFLEEICSNLGFKLENCVCIGDGDNDYELFKETKGITFTYSKEWHKELAWKTVSDLEEIRTIL
ncbi:HAD family hydrolase [Patescibacteria group bacterium]